MSIVAVSIVITCDTYSFNSAQRKLNSGTQITIILLLLYYWAHRNRDELYHGIC